MTQPSRSSAANRSASSSTRGEEGLVGHALVGEVGLEAQDRVAELPLLDLGRDAVLRRVVGGRVRTHAVGVGLDEQRAVAVAGLVEAVLRHGIRREDVVAVDADAREAEAAGALEERDAGLLLDGLGDGPLVVLAEEDDRGIEARGVDERLVDVTLRGGAVAEVADDGGVAVGVAGADVAVHPHAHRVARGVQRLGPDDDRVEVEVVLLRVPAALADAAEELQRALRVHAAHEADAVLAVGREDEVVRPERATGADLGGLLAEQAGPQAELALTLEGVALGVEPADEDEVAVEAPQVLGRQVRDVLVVVGVGHALTLGGQQLDHVRATVADRGGRLLQLGDNLVAHWGSFAGETGLLVRPANGGHPLVGFWGRKAAVRDDGHVLGPRPGTYRRGLRISQCGTVEQRPGVLTCADTGGSERTPTASRGRMPSAGLPLLGAVSAGCPTSRPEW